MGSFGELCGLGQHSPPLPRTTTAHQYFLSSRLLDQSGGTGWSEQEVVSMETGPGLLWVGSAQPGGGDGDKDGCKAESMSRTDKQG